MQLLYPIGRISACGLSQSGPIASYFGTATGDFQLDGLSSNSITPTYPWHPRDTCHGNISGKSATCHGKVKQIAGNVVIQPRPRFSINGILLATVLSCRDLGITCSHDSAHISGVSVKAHQRASIIFRSFVSRDVSLLLRTYLTYVRPLVERNSVVWSPCLKQDIETVERVQKTTRFQKPHLYRTA